MVSIKIIQVSKRQNEKKFEGYLKISSADTMEIV
jgi:hypothetical protein